MGGVYTYLEYHDSFEEEKLSVGERRDASSSISKLAPPGCNIILDTSNRLTKTHSYLERFIGASSSDRRPRPAFKHAKNYLVIDDI